MSDYIDKTNGSLARVSADTQIATSPSVEAVARYGATVVDSNMEKREAFLQKIFPNPAQRAAKIGELKIVETEFEFRKKALEMVRETQAQALRETCNQYLVKAKAGGRAETAEFLMRKAQELQAELDRILDKFVLSIEKKTQRLQALTNSTLQKKMEQDLDKEIHDFMEMKENLLNKFKNIVDEGV